MINNFNDFIMMLNKRGDKYKGSIYAQIIKNQRIKQNLTLSELSSGVCSISYLSKVENGLLDSNKDFFKCILDRVGVNFNEISNCNYDKVIENMIKAYFYDDFKEINDVYNKVINHNFNPINEIIKLFYFLKIQDYDSFLNSFNELDIIKDSLGYFEACCFIYLTSIYLIAFGKITTALDYLLKLFDMNYSNSFLKCLTIESILYCAVMSNKPSIANYFYIMFQKNYFTGYPAGKTIEMRMLYNLSICDELPETVIKDIDTVKRIELDNDSQLNVYYYLYLMKLKSFKYKEVFDDIYNNSILMDARFIAILAICCYHIDERIYYEKLLRCAEEHVYTSNDEIHKNIIDFILLYASNASDQDLISYLHNKIYNKTVKLDFYLYHKLYLEIYMVLLCSMSHYKEGFKALICNYFNLNDYKFLTEKRKRDKKRK